MNSFIITERYSNWRLLDDSEEILYYAKPFHRFLVNGYKIYDSKDKLVLELIWYSIFNPLFWKHIKQIPIVVFHDRELTIHKKSSLKIRQFKISIQTSFYISSEIYCFKGYGFLWENQRIFNRKASEIGFIEGIESKEGLSRDKMILEASVDPLLIFVMNLMYWGIYTF